MIVILQDIEVCHKNDKMFYKYHFSDKFSTLDFVISTAKRLEYYTGEEYHMDILINNEDPIKEFKLSDFRNIYT
jgi:hypothetical protein